MSVYEFPPITAEEGTPIARATALADCIGMLLRALGDQDYDDAAAREAGMISRAETKNSIRRMHVKLADELKRVK